MTALQFDTSQRHRADLVELQGVDKYLWDDLTDAMRDLRVTATRGANPPDAKSLRYLADRLEAIPDAGG